MSSQQKTVDFLVEQMSQAGTVTSRKMFGEYAVYCDSKVIGLVCDDQLFIKITDKGADFIGDCEKQPPYPGAKPYFLISSEHWDDADWLCELVQMTTASVPLPKKKSTLYTVGTNGKT